MTGLFTPFPRVALITFTANTPFSVLQNEAGKIERVPQAQMPPILHSSGVRLSEDGGLPISSLGLKDRSEVVAVFYSSPSVDVLLNSLLKRFSDRPIGLSSSMLSCHHANVIRRHFSIVESSSTTFLLFRSHTVWLPASDPVSVLSYYVCDREHVDPILAPHVEAFLEGSQAPLFLGQVNSPSFDASQIHQDSVVMTVLCVSIVDWPI